MIIIMCWDSVKRDLRECDAMTYKSKYIRVCANGVIKEKHHENIYFRT